MNADPTHKAGIFLVSVGRLRPQLNPATLCRVGRCAIAGVKMSGDGSKRGRNCLIGA